MICKNCGADIGNKGQCEYCDTVYFEVFQPQNANPTKGKLSKRESTPKGKSGKKRPKLTVPTKIVVGFWLLSCIVNFKEMVTAISYFQYAGIVIFGLFLYGGITQLISSSLKKRRMSKQPQNTTQPPLHPGVAALSPQPYDYMDAQEFKLFCCDVLAKSGFIGISDIKTLENQGIDIIAFKSGIRYGIQCLCSSSGIGMEAVQRVLTGKTFFGCDAAVIITNRYFAQNAKELAEKEAILLWDRDRLYKFIISHQ